MGNLTLTNKILDKYFGYLKNLDNKTKKRLIDKLSESIETGSDNKSDLKDLFGAWEDDRSAEEIISDIKNSRFNKNDIESFE